MSSKPYTITEEGVFYKHTFDSLFAARRYFPDLGKEGAGYQVLNTGTKVQVLEPIPDEEREKILAIEQDKRVSNAVNQMGDYNIIHIGARLYQVESNRKKSSRYEVDLDDNSCTCPDTTYRPSLICKHRVLALALERQQRMEAAEG